MATSESSFVSEKRGWKSNSNSKRWSSTSGGGYSMSSINTTKNKEYLFDQMESSSKMMAAEEKRRKRVMVVVDESIYSKHAMLWALTHVANKGDMLTLLQIHNHNHNHNPPPASNQLLASLATLCNACKPEVQVEALVIQGPKVATVVSQVKKLEVSVLVLGQKNTNCSPNFTTFLRCLGGGMRSRSSIERFVEECINTVECCLTIGVRKQSKGMGGYLISTRWRKDFWLLA